MARKSLSRRRARRTRTLLLTPLTVQGITAAQQATASLIAQLPERPSAPAEIELQRAARDFLRAIAFRERLRGILDAGVPDPRAERVLALLRQQEQQSQGSGEEEPTPTPTPTPTPDLRGFS